MKNKEYIAFFEYTDEKNGYSVVVPDIPGFHSAGDTYEDAVRNATEGMASHVELMHESGDEISEPSTLEEIKQNWDGWDDWNSDTESKYRIGLIPLMLPFGNSKVLISLDTALLSRIDRVAKNRSAFFSSAAEYMLDGKYNESRHRPRT